MGPVSFDHDSPLGRWRHTEWDDPPGLEGVVRKIWHFDGLTTHRLERAFPNGISELIVHLGERFDEARSPARGWSRCPGLCLSGLQSAPFVVRSPGRPTAVLGLRFTPLGAFRLLGGPVHPLVDQTVDLADAVGPLARSLEDRVLGASSGPQRVRRAAAWVAERVAVTALPDPGVAWVAGELERTHGALRIGALRGRTGFSRTRLLNGFREQVGVTPKRYARLLRFHRCLTLLAEPNPSLARIATAAGYYDQPHLNGEFREIAGMAPTEFLAATRYHGSVNLAE